jgi:hypothetical protein
VTPPDVAVQPMSDAVPPDDAAQPQPAPEITLEHGRSFETSLEWAAELDPKGLFRRFPLERDAGGRCLPLLLAVFDTTYLMNVILPRAVAAVGRLLPGAADLLTLGVSRDETDDETLRSNAIHLSIRPEIFQEVNRLLLLDLDDDEIYSSDLVVYGDSSNGVGQEQEGRDGSNPPQRGSHFHGSVGRRARLSRCWARG